MRTHDPDDQHLIVFSGYAHGVTDLARPYLRCISGERLHVGMPDDHRAHWQVCAMRCPFASDLDARFLDVFQWPQSARGRPPFDMADEFVRHNRTLASGRRPDFR